MCTIHARPHDQGAGNAASGTALSLSDRREPEAAQCSTTRAAELVSGLTIPAALETAAAGAWPGSSEVVAIKVHHLMQARSTSCSAAAAPLPPLA